MKKIVIYGAGRVGTTAALNLMRVKAQCKADIVLYAPHNHKRCEGALMDMEDACAMQNITPSFAFKATSDVADLADADAMVVCSGGLPSREMYEDAAQKAISYVKFSTADTKDSSGKTVEVTKEQKKEMKAQAKSLAGAENFDEAAQAAGVEVKTTTYGKDDSSLDEAVTKAADALEVGQVSDVIAVKNVGYYVVRLDSQYDEKATAEKKASLEEEQRSKAYNKQVESWKKKITWKVDKKQWAKVKFDTMFEAKATEENK